MKEREIVVSGDKELYRMFQRDIEKTPVLTRDEELIMARQAKAGDGVAANRLIESNLRFVLKVVFRFWYPGLPLMDMISEGCKGLIMALRTFDPEMGFRFITYAEASIRQRILVELRDYNRNVHDSLDDPVYDDDEDATLRDLLVSESTGADEMVFQDQIRSMLSALTDRERKIIVLRFWHDLTLEEIGLRIGLCKDRVRQIEARSLRKMRWSFRESFGADHGKTLADACFAGCKA